MKKVLLALIITTIVFQYIGTIFFLRTANAFNYITLILFSFFVLLIITIWYVIIEKSTSKKWFIGIGAVLSIVLFFALKNSLLKVADYVFIKLREDRLNEFVYRIKDYKRIEEMHDCTLYWQTINYEKISPPDVLTDTIKIRYDIFEDLKIDYSTYQDFCQRLIDIDLMRFRVLNEGTIFFTNDRFMSMRNGFAYTETGIKPKNFTRISRWHKITNNWYAWSER
jgi:hypothetical protein